MHASRDETARTLVSFDIDGTLETGDPPGPVSLDLVRRAQALGYVIGSASDRTLGFQRSMWAEHGIDVHFTGGKHVLHEVRDRWYDHRRIHIGDTDIDRHFARLADFEFVHVDRLPPPGAAGWVL